MSIADKLTYLQTTKQLLKTEINKINNVLTDNSTFRSYPQELFNGYLDVLNNGTDTLWNNLEKVSASGETPVLENVETAPMKMVLSGNTSQDTTSGKNLIAPNNLTETTVSGVTFTPIYEGKKLKYINVNGTSTSLISYDVSTIPLTLQAGTYFLSGCPTGGGNSTYELGLRYASFPRDLGNGVVLNLSAEATYSNCRIVIQNGVTVNNQKFYPMLEKSSTATSYEPYTGGQPSSNPDYPQQVKVVKGENVVSVQGKNLLDKSSNIVLNKYIGEDGAISGNSPQNWYQEDYIEVSNSTDYIISTTSSNYVRVAFYDDSKNFISRIVANGGIQISTTSSTKYLRLSGYDNLNDNIQLELGSTATPYVPYSKTDYPINLASKNLFSTENLVNATITDTGEYLTGDNRCTGDYVFLDKSQENLALSFNLNILFMGIAFYDENKQYLSRATINNTNLLTAPIPTNAEYCRPFFQFTTSPAAKIDAKIVQQLGTQLEYGTERTNYVSYFTPIELCKINTYKDYFHKDSGKWYVHKAINKILIKNIEGYTEEKGIRVTAPKYDIPVKAYPNLYSNYFKEALNYGESVDGKNKIAINFNGNILTSISGYTNINQYKTFFTNNDVYVYYPLATPTEEEITNSTLIEQLEAISNAKSVKDKTYIAQTNEELPFILDVEAIKEYSVE